MKKSLIIVIIICSLVIVLKYRFSNYDITYKVDNYNIKTVYKNKRFYYEINDNENTYNFDIYSSRSFNKNMISSIKEISDESFKCIYPVIKGKNTYPLCYLNGVYTDYNLIDSELLSEYKKEKIDISKPSKDFVYHNNLSSDEYVALWNYKGYIVMNDKQYKNVDLFTKDKYDNSLAYIIDDSIYMANNDEEHEFTKLIKLNLRTLEKDEIKIGHNVDFDSYIVGNIKNKLYLFDNKYSILYEIDVKKKKVEIIGNNEKGYVKYENGNFITCSKSEYKVNKIKINNKKSNYTYSDDGIYKAYNDNKKILLKINNNTNKIVKENYDDIYYQYKDNFYKYNPYNGSELIFYNYELTFNSENTIFVYNK